MRKRWIVLGLATAVGLMAAATLIVLVQPEAPAPLVPATAIDHAEHARTIEAMRRQVRPGRERPVIAIVALNEATEVTDLLVPYGVLSRADVAEIAVVAEQAGPIALHPFGVRKGPELLRVDPHATLSAFDERHPDGADYVIVPAMQPRDSKAVLAWIAAQYRKGARIVSVCNGAMTLAAAGLLDGRRATAHWNGIRELQAGHPTMQWVPDRRYVVDNGIVTSTGISAAMPVAVALADASAGRPKAAELAAALGLSGWDARHRSSAFRLDARHKRTFVRNWLSLWRHESIGVLLEEGVDEIALALTADAYARTALTSVVTVGPGGAVHSKHGLMLRPVAASGAVSMERMLVPPRGDAPALAIERVLAQIAKRFDRPTAAIVALAMEYPWTGEAELETR